MKRADAVSGTRVPPAILRTAPDKTLRRRSSGTLVREPLRKDSLLVTVDKLPTTNTGRPWLVGLKETMTRLIRRNAAGTRVAST